MKTGVKVLRTTLLEFHTTSMYKFQLTKVFFSLKNHIVVIGLNANFNVYGVWQGTCIIHSSLKSINYSEVHSVNGA